MKSQQGNRSRITEYVSMGSSWSTDEQVGMEASDVARAINALVGFLFVLS